MSETVANREAVTTEELSRQKDLFLQRAVALHDVFGENETHIENRVAGASIELNTPPELRFSVYRKDGQAATATTMGRFSDFHSSVGDRKFDSTNPLKIDRITATVKAWVHEKLQVSLTFESDDPAYYNTFTIYGQNVLDGDFAIDVEPVVATKAQAS